MAQRFNPFDYVKEYAEGAEAIGIKKEHAEYQAQQMYKFIENNLVTKSDLNSMEERFNFKLSTMEKRFNSKLSTMEEQFDSKLSSMEERFNFKLSSMEERFNSKLIQIEQQLIMIEQKLVIKLGGIMFAGITILGIIFGVISKH